MMTNMAMDAEEAAEQSVAPGEDATEGPKYPYGLELSLDDGSMEKLGITALPDVGYVMKLTAMVTVTNVGSSQSQGGDAEMRMSLQITDMQLDAPAMDSSAMAAKLYG